MAKVCKSVLKKPRGPFLDAALICEDFVQESDHAISPIRLVNRIMFHERLPEPGNVIPLPLFLFLSFKAGEIVGERKYTLLILTPSGERREFLKNASLGMLQGGDTGANAIIQIHLPYDGEGTYWIEVTLGGKRYSQVPLTVLFKPAND
jgi:hypothetical protein